MRGLWLLLIAAGCLAALPAASIRRSDRVPVFATGGERGALEPCGCAQNQLGGLSRRGTALAAERPDPAAALTLSCGGFLRATGRLDALTLETGMTALALMRYDAHVPSARELRLGKDAVALAVAAGVPWLGANVQPAAPETPPLQVTLTKDVGGRSVTVLGLVVPDGEPVPDYTVSDPAEALSELPTDGVRVVVVAGPLAAARELAARVPADVLVLAGDPLGSPTSRPLDGHVVCAGERGHFVLAADALQPAADTRLIPLDGSWPLDAPVHDVVLLHRQRIVMEGLLDELYEQTDPPSGATYVGPEKCFGCHEKAYNVWKDSRHGHALDSLRPDERQLDPDCLQCHSTGFGVKSGFAGEERTPALAKVSCESCHGPGSKHVDAPLLVKPPGGRDCLQCHDLENSPHFDRAVYWPKILHGK